MVPLSFPLPTPKPVLFLFWSCCNLLRQICSALQHYVTYSTNNYSSAKKMLAWYFQYTPIVSRAGPAKYSSYGSFGNINVSHWIWWIFCWSVHKWDKNKTEKTIVFLQTHVMRLRMNVALWRTFHAYCDMTFVVLIIWLIVVVWLSSGIKVGCGKKNTVVL